jgi:hypothetical protein
MSNMAGVTKDMYPEGTTAHLDGFKGPHGEVLLGVEFTQAEVDEWNGTSSDLPATGASATSSASPKPKRVTAKSTKEEMEIAGRDMGIELDRRKSKKSLWSQLKKAMK